MSSISDVVVVTYKGRMFHAVPYLPDGKIKKFLIMNPGSNEVIHEVEGPWISNDMARLNIKERVMELIDKEKL